MRHRRRQHNQDHAHNSHGDERRSRNAGEIPHRAADHGDDDGAAIADGEHRRADAVHVLRRRQQRRQRQCQNQDQGTEEADHRGRRHDDEAASEHDEKQRGDDAEAGKQVRPRRALQPACRAEQQQRRGELADIECGQRRADPFHLSGMGQVVRQERVAAEIGCVDRTQHQAELPDQAVVPVRPPATRGRERACGLLHARRERPHQHGDHGDRCAPDRERPLPASDPRQDHRNGQADRDDFADDETVGVDGGGEADPLRHPQSHHGRHRYLHDRDAGAGDDGHAVQQRDMRIDAAQRSTDGGEHEADDQRRQHAEPRNQQRAGDRGETEQHRR